MIESSSIQPGRIYTGALDNISAGPEKAPTRKPEIILSVQTIENGFIVRLSFDPGVIPKEIFIATLEELPDVIAAQMAAHKIGV